MPLIDISLTITDKLPTWDGHEPGIKIEWPVQHGVDSADCCVSSVQFGSHLGTHLDAPLHFVPGGGTVERIPLDLLVGPVVIVDIPDIDGTEISDEMLASLAIPDYTRRLLLRTSNTRRQLLQDSNFHADFVGISKNAAQWIIDRGIGLVGIDYLSIGSALTGTGGEVHRALLGAGLVVVESLDLREAPAGQYTLICLPLKIAGVEGSPVRALLATGEGSELDLPSR